MLGSYDARCQERRLGAQGHPLQTGGVASVRAPELNPVGMQLPGTCRIAAVVPLQSSGVRCFPENGGAAMAPPCARIWEPKGRRGSGARRKVLRGLMSNVPVPKQMPNQAGMRDRTALARRRHMFAADTLPRCHARDHSARLPFLGSFQQACLHVHSFRTLLLNKWLLACALRLRAQPEPEQVLVVHMMHHIC